jgi:RNA polymerase sigma factor (sigma-70 family)
VSWPRRRSSVRSWGAHRLLERLPVQRRAVVVGYWFEDRSQAELAAELGVSQMQVSRPLRRSLERMRQLAPTIDLERRAAAERTTA